MLVSLLRMLVLYPIVIFGIRLMGKRQIGELQPAELVITILISNIATLPIEDPDLPLLIGICPMLLLISAEVLLSFCALKSRGLRRLLCGSPQIIVREGVIDQAVMHSLRFSLDDLLSALRAGGIFDLSEVRLAIVETNGKVSVCTQPERPPEVLIADGTLSEAGLQAAGMTRQQLGSMLKPAGLLPEQVFLLTADANGIVTLQKKEADA